MSQTSGQHARKRLATVPERKKKDDESSLIVIFFFFAAAAQVTRVYCPINRHTQSWRRREILYKLLEGTKESKRATIATMSIYSHSVCVCETIYCVCVIVHIHPPSPCIDQPADKGGGGEISLKFKVSQQVCLPFFFKWKNEIKISNDFYCYTTAGPY